METKSGGRRTSTDTSFMYSPLYQHQTYYSLCVQLLAPCSDRSWNCPPKTKWRYHLFLHRRDVDPRRHTTDSTRDGSDDAWVKKVILTMETEVEEDKCCWKINCYFKGRNPFIVFFYYFKMQKEYSATCLYYRRLYQKAHWVCGGADGKEDIYPNFLYPWSTHPGHRGNQTSWLTNLYNDNLFPSICNQNFLWVKGFFMKSVTLV